MANIIRLGGGAGGALPTLITKIITQNGTYNAIDDNADGYSSVEVNVPTGGDVQTIGLHSGKIKLSTGTIEADDDYFYTDEFPCPNGVIYLDVGATSSSDYIGVISYDDNAIRKGSANPSSRFRSINLASVYSSGARTLRLSFPVSYLLNVVLQDTVNSITYTGNPVWLTNESGGVSYEDISLFDNYFNRNTSTPVINPISTTEVGLSFTIESATGYEGASFSVPLNKGLYVAEIEVTISAVSSLANYSWGVYTATSTAAAQSYRDAETITSQAYNTYVPFDKTSSSIQKIEVPIKMLADGTAYICFSMAADNGNNASVTVSSLKIRKA